MLILPSIIFNFKLCFYIYKNYLSSSTLSNGKRNYVHYAAKSFRVQYQISKFGVNSKVSILESLYFLFTPTPLNLLDILESYIFNRTPLDKY